jgi:deoxyribonuclease-4
MVRYGFHFSIGKGLAAAARDAAGLGCTAMQVFPGNPRGWEQKDLDPADAEEFRRLTLEHDIRPVVIHLPYLPNLASPDKALYARSVAVLVGAVRKASLMGAEYVNAHAGNAMGSGRTGAMRRVASAVDTALRAVKDRKVSVLIENSAGGGTEVGSRFEDLRSIIGFVKDRKRAGICLDTAHLFAAGYDLRTPASVRKTIGEFGRIVGLTYLKALHFNDSMTEMGSLHDRHQHLGRGTIGKAGMKALVNDPRLARLAFIMETPKATEADDRRNLRTLRTLIHQG